MRTLLVGHRQQFVGTVTEKLLAYALGRAIENGLTDPAKIEAALGHKGQLDNGVYKVTIGRTTKMHITVTQGHKVVHGVRVQIKGPGVHLTTKPSNAKGKITQKIHPKKAGIVTFKPIVKAGSVCKVPRIGITGVFTPPVTG